MSKTAVVYWSGTGNTEAMANAVLGGMKQAGAQAQLFSAADFDAALVPQLDAIAFGCPSMGSEELEETEFAPMFDACEAALRGRRIALFGSYGWGDGEWMRSWESRCAELGALLACPSVICNNEPEEDTLSTCRALGKTLA